MESEKEKADRELAKACTSAMKALDAAMPFEKDGIMRHTLGNLRAELCWCAREYGEACDERQN